MPSFFFRELQLSDSYMSLNKRFVSLKLSAGFSIFDPISLLLKFIFYSAKCKDSLTLKRQNSFQY